MSTSFWLDRTAKAGRKTYDAIIVGAGISGLSTAYWLNKEDPSLKIAIIEKITFSFWRQRQKRGLHHLRIS